VGSDGMGRFRWESWGRTGCSLLDRVGEALRGVIIAGFSITAVSDGIGIDSVKGNLLIDKWSKELATVSVQILKVTLQASCTQVPCFARMRLKRSQDFAS